MVPLCECVRKNRPPSVAAASGQWREGQPVCSGCAAGCAAPAGGDSSAARAAALPPLLLLLLLLWLGRRPAAGGQAKAAGLAARRGCLLGAAP
jgi:hypothetical protein